MRFEVRQQDEKWMVWDKVNDCEMTVGARRPKLTAANSEARPAAFWTQKEAQACTDFLNDLDLQGFMPGLF